MTKSAKIRMTCYCIQEVNIMLRWEVGSSKKGTILRIYAILPALLIHCQKNIYKMFITE